MVYFDSFFQSHLLKGLLSRLDSPGTLVENHLTMYGRIFAGLFSILSMYMSDFMLETNTPFCLCSSMVIFNQEV